MDEFFDSKDISLDDLTKLYGRDVIIRYVYNLILRRVPFSLALVDIDNFKYINDTHGHDIGDKIMYEVAARIKKQLGDTGYVGRFNSDEFIIIMPDVVNYDGIWQTCHKIVTSISEGNYTSLEGLALSVTLGLSRYPENATTYERLLDMAGKALYRGKVKGRNCFIIYLPEKHANIVVRTDKKKQLSSIYLHALVFDCLTKNDDLKTGINNLFDFLCNYYNIDHLCIQSKVNSDEYYEDKIFFEKIHHLSRNKTFKPVRFELIRESVNKSVGMLCLNDVKQLVQTDEIDLYDVLTEQQITSTCFVNISYQDETYGVLRADMVGLPNSHKIWEYGDMDIFLTIAKTIGLILHCSKQKIEEL